MVFGILASKKQTSKLDDDDNKDALAGSTVTSGTSSGVEMKLEQEEEEEDNSSSNRDSLVGAAASTLAAGSKLVAGGLGVVVSNIGIPGIKNNNVTSENEEKTTSNSSSSIAVIDTTNDQNVVKQKNQNDKKQQPEQQQQQQITSSERSTQSYSSSIGEEVVFGSAPPGSVYEECMIMLAGALMIYTYADLRRMAREKKLESTQTTLEQLEPPISSAEILEKVSLNKEILIESDDMYSELNERIDALKIIHQNSQINYKTHNLLENSATSRLAIFEDTNAKNEMVHAIFVNDVRQRITVIFRGSVTQKDFVTDAKLTQSKIPNPLFDLLAPSNDDGGSTNKTCNDNIDINLEGKLPETISIHSGFHDYLSVKNSETGKTRLETILDEIQDLLIQNPGYTLYFCGHSLGGALATLVAFYAAANTTKIWNHLNHLNSGSGGTIIPIRCYSIASPYVGNIKFLLSFQYLERYGRIQHLRVCNAEDIVTLMPFAAPKIMSLFSPAYALSKGIGSMYYHCGIRLKLTKALTKTTEEEVTEEDEEEIQSDNSDDDNGRTDSERSKRDKQNRKKEKSGKKTTWFLTGSVKKIPSSNKIQDGESTDKWSLSFPKADQDNEEKYAKEITDMIKDGKNLLKSMGMVFTKNATEVTKYHSCEEYEARLAKVRRHLMDVSLDDLYNDKDIVGNVLDMDYESKIHSSTGERWAKIKESTFIQSKIKKELGFSSSPKNDNDDNNDDGANTNENSNDNGK